MDVLLSAGFAPITHTIGFLACDPETAVEAFVKWQRDIQSKRGVSLGLIRINSDFVSGIRSLLPLTSVKRRRFLFAPTRSKWTVFLDNGHQGTDAFAHISYLAKMLSCQGIRATHVPDGCGDAYPATIFEMYGPDKTDFLNITRSVSVSFDGSKWSFSAAGTVQPFENLDSYSKRIICQRFTAELLKSYLKYLGIEAFDQNFFCLLNADAILVSKTGPIASASREFTLSKQ